MASGAGVGTCVKGLCRFGLGNMGNERIKCRPIYTRIMAQTSGA